MANKKVDLKKELKQFYKPKIVPEIITVPPMNFLMIDGKGAIGGPIFQEAIEALFSVSYKTKFLAKKSIEFDYTVMPLEGLWWADNMDDFEKGNKDNWNWTLMIMQPEQIADEMISSSVTEVKKKKDNKSLAHLRFETYNEGMAAQIMHIGPFSEEHENIMKLHTLIKDHGGSFDGKIHKHHEVYLSDFRKVDPEKMKVVLRQPFAINK